MAFVNSLFPNPKLVHDLVTEMARPMNIVGNSETEQRISRLQTYKYIWTWPGRGMLSTERAPIQNFIRDTARFSQNSFKFKSPSSNKWFLTPLQWAGSANLFKLTERGLDDHPIYHLAPGVLVHVNGVPAAFEQQMYGGKPVIAVTGATSGSTVTISGNYYFAARFEDAVFSFASVALDANNEPFGDNISDLVLREVFEFDEGLW